MDINENTLKEILENIKPDLKVSLQEEFKRSLTRQIQFQFDNHISQFCREWIDENILPELKKQLVESKDGFIKLATDGCNKVIDEMAIGMANTIKEKMNNSYHRSKIFQAMFD